MNHALSDRITDAGAVFSRCGIYRYRLWRAWAPGRRCLFVLLNPSTADGSSNDPTIERCQRFAERWGFGSLTVCNLFAYRATEPRDLKRAGAPVGPRNNQALLAAARAADQIVCGWGNHGLHRDRSAEVMRLLDRDGHALHALKLNRSGQPAHPLYLRADCRPRRFKIGKQT